MLEKFKSFIADDAVFTVFLLLLVGVISFGLGRQSVGESLVNSSNKQAAGVVFTESPFNSAINAQNSATSTQKSKVISDSSSSKVVASRSGSKYHRLSCSGAKRIKEENKIYFETIEQARAAGYTPAANCKGLE